MVSMLRIRSANIWMHSNCLGVVHLPPVQKTIADRLVGVVAWSDFTKEKVIADFGEFNRCAFV